MIQFFVCNGKDGCGKRFNLESALNYHIIHNHKRRQTQVCELCGASYRCKVSLQRHIINFHGIGEKKFSCPSCNKMFGSAVNLKKHLSTHRTTKDFGCTVCSKAFSTRQFLTQHMVCHRPPTHECMFCGKMFLYRAAGLGTHLKQVHRVDVQGNPLCLEESKPACIK